ncbi:MAG: hypothetical protein R3F62_30130 [Planctomycetota bacterium]
MNARLALAALALCVLGCQSTPEQPDRPTYSGPYGLDNRIDVEFDQTWEEIEVTRTGEKDATQKAFFVTQRRNAALRCIKADPPCLLQAIEILDDILSHVPDASEPQLLMARTQFQIAAYWFKVADVIAWNMQYIDYNRKTPEDEYGRQVELSDDEVEGLVADYKPWLDRANQGIRRAAEASIKHFTIYQRLHPEDLAIHEYVWRLHFFLQNYQEALTWLKAVLARMDRQEVEPEDPIRVKHEQIRQAIEDYLANLRLTGESGALKPDILPPFEIPDRR